MLMLDPLNLGQKTNFYEFFDLCALRSSGVAIGDELGVDTIALERFLIVSRRYLNLSEYDRLVNADS